MTVGQFDSAEKEIRQRKKTPLGSINLGYFDHRQPSFAVIPTKSYKLISTVVHPPASHRTKRYSFFSRMHLLRSSRFAPAISHFIGFIGFSLRGCGIAVYCNNTLMIRFHVILFFFFRFFPGWLSGFLSCVNELHRETTIYHFDVSAGPTFCVQLGAL